LVFKDRLFAQCISEKESLSQLVEGFIWKQNTCITAGLSL